MHTSEVERLLRSEGGNPGREWPPKSEARAWETVRERRIRYENDASELWRLRPELHVPEDPRATDARFRDWTPVPLSRDIARFSSQLLFSDPPALSHEGEIEQQALDAWGEFNALAEFLSGAGEHIAAEGSGALRIIRDDHVHSRFPLIVFEPADRIVSAVAHGRYVTGGIVVVEREGDGDGGVRWRLLEYHGAGVVRRALYKGGITRLGNRVPLASGPPEFRELRDEVRTGVDRPTLIQWFNVPGGHSDIAGLDSILDALDDAETVARQKSRASKPLTFVHRKLTDRSGNADLDGAIIVGDGNTSPVESPEELARVVQGKMEAADHRTYQDHLRELAVSLAGYSLASWGFGDGGRADSGRALKLRQVRTLLTRSGKERMARAAISEAAGIALAMMLGRPAVEPLKPEIRFGDGFPVDRIEQAQELGALRQAGLISVRQALRELRPDWPEDRIEAELGDIAAEAPETPGARLERLVNGGSQ